MIDEATLEYLKIHYEEQKSQLEIFQKDVVPKIHGQQGRQNAQIQAFRWNQDIGQTQKLLDEVSFILKHHEAYLQWKLER
jgi:hypothetical protein